jgi:hypothetical protein
MVLATSQQEFSDADFRVVDNADQSKKLAFQLSGLTTGTTRVWTVPDANYTFPSSGTYSPTLTNTTNVASSSGSAATKWSRVGDIVTVAGQVSIDPTLAAPTDTVLEISLPVASNIGAVTHVSGTATEPTSSGQVATITGSVANDTAVLSFSASDVASKTWQFVFMYSVI